MNKGSLLSSCHISSNLAPLQPVSTGIETFVYASFCADLIMNFTMGYVQT